VLLKSIPKLSTVLSCVYFSAGKSHTSHYVNEITTAHLKVNLENQFPVQKRFSHFGEFTSHTMYLQDLISAFGYA